MDSLKYAIPVYICAFRRKLTTPWWAPVWGVAEPRTLMPSVLTKRKQSRALSKRGNRASCVRMKFNSYYCTNTDTTVAVFNHYPFSPYTTVTGILGNTTESTIVLLLVFIQHAFLLLLLPRTILLLCNYCFYYSLRPLMLSAIMSELICYGSSLIVCPFYIFWPNG